jgi:hypothetical protein
MAGRFNLFQATMLRWRALHPYNAVHVIAVPVALDVPRLTRLIASTLEATGLTGYVLDAARGRFAYEGGPAEVDVTVVEGGSNPMAVACRMVEEELNVRFPPMGRFNPFRFFAVTHGSGFHLGLAYDHLVAGGDSIAALLTGLADRYPQAAGPIADPAPLDRYPATYGTLFRHYAGALLRGLADLPAEVAAGRCAARSPSGNLEDGTNGFLRLGIGREQLRRMRIKAQAWGVGVNDLVLSIVLASVSTLVPERGSAPRRKHVAVATIVNVRADYQPGTDTTFGQFLSSFRVFHPVPEGASLEHLARDVHTQTRRVRERRLYLLTLLTMGFAGLIWRFLDRDHKLRFYFKYHPALAGVTGLNINTFRRSGRSADGDYLRGASTGPLAPIVFATTSSGEAMEIGITYRVSVLSREQVETVGKQFQLWMESLQ